MLNKLLVINLIHIKMQFSEIDIIFAYCGLNNRQKISLISQQSADFCHTHQYIISLPAEDVRQVFFDATRQVNVDLTLRCFKNPRLNPNVDINCRDYQSKNPFLNWVIEGNIDVIKRFMIDPRFDPTLDNGMMAFSIAVYYDFCKIIRLLLTDPRITNVISDGFRDMLLSHLVGKN